MRIAVVAVGTRGDVEPHAALCERLRAAGYDARLCAPDDYGETCRERGIPLDPIPVSFRDLYDTADGRELLASGSNGIQFLRGLGRMAGHSAERVISGIRAACSDADAVCYSPLGISARYFARERGIPAIATSLQPLGRTGEFANPLLPLPRWTPSMVNRLSHRLVEELFWRLVRPALQTQMRDARLVRDHFREIYSGPGPALFAYSDLVVPRPSDWKPWMHATGYWVLREAEWQPPDGLEEFLERGQTLCMGFGSMRSVRVEKIIDTALEVLTREGRRAVVLTGWSSYRDLPSGRHGNVFILPAAPHDWLFPRVSAVIHHGGAGTTAAALRAGAPSVMVPFFFDQEFWAKNLAARGMGPPPVRFERLTAETFGRALDAAEDSPDIRGRLGRLGAELRREDGVGIAVAIIARSLESAAR